MYNMDKLYEAVAQRGHVCVGLDTAPEYIPPEERKKAASPAAAVLAYNKALAEALADTAACFKVQIACYEELGLPGLSAYAETLKFLRGLGCLVIADIKRGDIADTATRYARAHFEGDFEADFVTLSPYMGMDAISPWLKYAETRGKGAFVLIRTSNPGMRDFEYRELREGGRLYDAVGDKLSELAESHRGTHGYGAFGAVVGADPKSADEREEVRELRRRRDTLFFLIPGYGAQGGAAEDAALLLREGNGGVVNASRSILKAWMTGLKDKTEEGADISFAIKAARQETIKMRDIIRAALEKPLLQ
jgi:orotidine-5'-phosphate decarboxylase